MDITKNTILITGGATGIGFGLAKKFAGLGNEVIICGRRESRLIEAKEAIPALHYKVCDLGNAEERVALYNWVVENFPSLNVLINNGAYQNDYSLVDGPAALEGAGDEINVILTAPIMMNALFTDHLRNIPGSAIVNVTSVLGFMPKVRIPIYCAAKAGLHAYTLVQRRQYEVAGIDIKIFEAAPPLVESELNMQGRINAGYSAFKGMSPDDYADFVIEHMEKDELDIFYGQDGQDTLKLRYDLERKRVNEAW